MELIIGSHVSYNKNEQLLGCVKEALNYGSNTFMFYTGAPQNTTRMSIDNKLTKTALELMKEHNIDINNVVVHAPYIINLANKNNADFGIRFMKEEIERTEALGVSMIVLHPGSHVGVGEEEGLKNIIACLNEIITPSQKAIILLETMAGKGSELGTNFKDLKYIIANVKYKDKLGICFDTCHTNDSGYDIKKFDIVLDEFDKEIGLEYLKCVHINDSKNVIGSHKDRHENFGFGDLGFETLINVVYHPKLKDVPKILETPYVTLNDDSKERLYPPYKFEIEMIKNKKFDIDLIKKIREYYNSGS